MEIILNPSPYDENIGRCDLSKVSLFLLNEIEGNQMTSETDPDRILDRLQEMYPGAEAVLTLGERRFCLSGRKNRESGREFFRYRWLTRQRRAIHLPDISWRPGWKGEVQRNV